MSEKKRTTSTKVYYHFTGDVLRDGTPIPPIGKWLTFKGEPRPCVCGLHASPTAFDALQYAPGPKLHRVHLNGTIRAHGDPVDKFAAQKRKIIATIDAGELCRAFARRVALDVIHLWNAPAIVREYLETGDESKRAAARDAARDAAWAAARDAARYAAWAAARAAARDAAWAAARDAAWDAAWAAARYAAKYAAWAAARDAAWAAARDKYRGWFNEMVDAEFAKAEGQ